MCAAHGGPDLQIEIPLYQEHLHVMLLSSVSLGRISDILDTIEINLSDSM